MAKIDSKILQKHYPFKNNYFELKNGNSVIKMHYVDEGRGEPVIMLHGNPTWSFYYRHLIKTLSPFMRCLAIDHVGCGLSDKPQNYDYCLKNHIQNVIDWMDSLQIGRFHLIVHDWGGAIGMGVAIRWPARVKTLTILNSAAYLSESIPLAISMCRFPVLGTIAVKYMNLFAKTASLICAKNGLSNEVKNCYLLPYNSPKNRVAINAFVKDIPMHTNHPSYNTLANIEDNLWILNNKPILMLWGMRDFCFNKKFLTEWQNYFNKARTIKYENAGHYILEDEKDSANLEIKKFLAANQTAFTYENSVPPIPSK